MKLFKKYDHGMWHVHAFESDGSQDAYIKPDMIAISDTEADEIRAQSPSAEYQAKLDEGRRALGGRNGARYPPKEFKEAIGHICVNSSHLEVSIRTVIWHVAGLDSDTGMAFTGNSRIQELLQTLQTLVDAKANGLSEQCRAICSRVNSLFKARAKYVHRIWMIGKSGNPVVSKVFIERSFAKADEQEVSIDQMYDLAEGFLQIESDLMTQILHPLLLPHS